MGRVDGKVALVSGGARGLGRAMAEELVAEGARVVIGDVLDDEARGHRRELGDGARAIDLDVTSEAAAGTRRSRPRSPSFGRLDVLVNNAGHAEGAPLATTTLESYRRVIEVNQIGVFLGMRAAIDPMTAAGGGSIVNISSIDGMVGSPRHHLVHREQVGRARHDQGRGDGAGAPQHPGQLRAPRPRAHAPRVARPTRTARSSSG